MNVPGFGRGRVCPSAGGRHLRRGKIQRMGRRIDAHGSRAPGSLDGLDDLKFARRCLPDHGQSAVAATGKNVTVEFRGIHAGANREVGEDLAIVGIHDDQLLRLSTPDKQASSRDVHGHADR